MIIARGTIIDGRVEIQKVLGQGGMGTVYRARQLGLDREVAIKFLLALPGAQLEWQARFEREAHLLCQLNHRNIPTFYGFGVWNSSPYMIVELVDGVPLDTEIERCGALQAPRALALIAQICHALGYAHLKGVVHRDLKPGNVIIASDDTVKLIDFGLAKSVVQNNQQSLTEAGTTVGTLLYMSPEQCLGKESSIQSDIYSLGCVLFHLLAGVPPFDGDHSMIIMHRHVSEPPPLIASYRPDLAQFTALQTLLERCLAKEPQSRYETAGQVLADIEALLRADEFKLYAQENKEDMPVPVIQTAALTPKHEPALGLSQRRAPRRKPLLIGLSCSSALLATFVALCASTGWTPGKTFDAQKKYVQGQNKEADYWYGMALDAARSKNLKDCLYALQRFESLKKCDDWQPEANCLRLAGDTFLNAAESVHAHNVYLKWAQLERLHRPNSIHEAIALARAGASLNLARASLETQRCDYDRAREICKSLAGTPAAETINYASVLISLGSFELRTRQFDEACRDLGEGVALLAKLGQNTSDVFAIAKYRLGRAQLGVKHDADGFKTLAGVFPVLRDHHPPALALACAEVLVALSITNNQFELAGDYLKQANSLIESLPNKDDVTLGRAWKLASAAHIFYCAHKWDKTIELAENSLELYENYEKTRTSEIEHSVDVERAPIGRQDWVFCHTMLADAYRARGDNKTALAQAEAGLKLARRFKIKHSELELESQCQSIKAQLSVSLPERSK